MDGLTFIAIIAICLTVGFLGTAFLCHLSNASAQRHAERMAEIAEEALRERRK